MTFDVLLNTYIEQLDCSAKELSQCADLSAAVISRYRTGDRRPTRESEHLTKLAAGIAVLAAQKGLSGFSAEAVQTALSEALWGKVSNPEAVIQKLNALIDALSLNTTDLSHDLNLDASFVSRIRSGKRLPADLEGFVDGICRFTTRHSGMDTEQEILAALIGCSAESLLESSARTAALHDWLFAADAPKPEAASAFLQKLDDFDLNEYIRAIHFDEMKVPTVPFQLGTSKNYYGLEQMKQGELDFLKATVLSRSMEPVLMCNDMPMQDLAEDLEFSKKYMLGLAMMLKKGLQLRVIHNLDRPFAEMMLGLESWIPLYMTGQLTSYYFKRAQSSIYRHFDNISGGAALSGECISGAHEKGKYYLTKNREELDYYHTKADLLLKKALPLMRTFDREAAEQYRSFWNADLQKQGHRQHILTSPPLHSLSDDLLRRILRHNAIDTVQAEQILQYTAQQRQLISDILAHSTIEEELSCIEADEFARFPTRLSLTGLFYETDICYTYAEYQEHLALTRAYAETHENYSFRLTTGHAFRNLQIRIRKGQWVMVSKSKHPVIHFVIEHPKLCRAIENMIIPVSELADGKNNG